MKSDNPLSYRNILAGIIVTVIGGTILAIVIQDARFAPVANSTPTSTIRSINTDTPLPSSPTQTQLPPTITSTALIDTDTPLPSSPTQTQLPPTATSIALVVDTTPTQPAPTPVVPTPTIDRHPGEVNLLESNKVLPTDWFTNGQYTYWEGFLHVQDEPFIDITIADCGDNEGNRRLDIVQIFSPDGTLAVNDRNCDGNPKYRLRTYQKPGYYRVFLQDNDTGGRDGNGGTLSVDMLKDQTIYKNLP